MISDTREVYGCTNKIFLNYSKSINLLTDCWKAALMISSLNKCISMVSLTANKTAHLHIAIILFTHCKMHAIGEFKHRDCQGPAVSRM